MELFRYYYFRFNIDIWGNTVNVASRMDSTCVPGEIQCTQEVVDSLQGSHFEFRWVPKQFNNFHITHTNIGIFMMFIGVVVQ